MCECCLSQHCSRSPKHMQSIHKNEWKMKEKWYENERKTRKNMSQKLAATQSLKHNASDNKLLSRIIQHVSLKHLHAEERPCCPYMCLYCPDHFLSPENIIRQKCPSTCSCFELYTVCRSRLVSPSFRVQHHACIKLVHCIHGLYKGCDGRSTRTTPGQL